ncbi:polyhydroxyalkanoate depolymerase [Xanthobacter tagetidis]|uniref:Polyhydroxyalkanoate depolymerase n=1 Tax=Xanthobacter tagetidis TaxID=60216 RepID=A0A3L7A4K6_9HYPH|nr:polyhydroxyalkanoate depolymerase [Xanthobacter tagetidis]MBB6309266.1 poly(3-hydroxybutyrate) depolymerase [Xanthobacter tagetidis]RLP74222.1 polyhydroxyalkanoate depolymerase [Xanthobacter tagetidis]
MWLDDHRPMRLGPPPAGAGPGDDAFRDFGILSVDHDGVRVPVQSQILAHLPFGVLRSFRRSENPRRRALVVAPLAGSYPLLMRDLVVALLAPFDAVAVTDWPNARDVPLAAGRFGFAENCMEAAQMARALGGGPDDGGAPVHLVGVCQGVVPALVAALMLSEEGAAPASLTLMGGPVDPSRNPTRLWRILQDRSLDALEAQVIETVRTGFPGAGRRVFPAWRQMDTFGLYLWRQALSGGEMPMKLTFDEGADPLRFPLSRLCWTMMDVAAEFFMENVATIFRENALARGTLAIAGRPVRPQALARTALLTVEAEDDDISAPCQTAAAHDLCAGVPEGLRRRLTLPKAGHFSLFYGHAMRRAVVPAIAGLAALTEGAPPGAA